MASARGRRLIGVAPLAVAIDDVDIAPEACLGAAGARLTVRLAAITGPEDAIERVERTCHRAGLVADGASLGVIAAGAAALTPEERNGPTFVIDFGAAQTGVALFAGGCATAARTFNRGGDAITETLARAVSTTRAAAERVKIAHGDVSGHSEDRAVIEFAQLNADGRLSPGAAARATVLAAIRGAWLEILTDLRPALDQADPAGRAGVVMVGGGALTLGLGQLVERALGRRARLGRPIGFGARCVRRRPGLCRDVRRAGGGRCGAAR
jgi:cell division protein FtsA